MKILITGATGFIGKTLIPYLLSHGIKDIALLIRNKQKAAILFPNFPCYIITTEKENNWRKEVIDYSPDTVLHLATLFTGKNDVDSIYKIIDNNILFTTLLLEAISHTNCKHFINIGTFSEFVNGNGQYLSNNLYSASKTAVRPIIKYYQKQSKFKFISVIIYSPYGRKNTNKKVIDYMIDAIDSNEPVNFTKGEQILDFIHVDDIANFFYTLLFKLSNLKKSYYEFHLGSGIGHSVYEVGSVIEKVFNKKINGIWGGRKYNSSDIMFAIAPINKNIELLGWKSKISLIEGINILHNEIIQD